MNRVEIIPMLYTVNSRVNRKKIDAIVQFNKKNGLKIELNININYEKYVRTKMLS